MNTGAEAVETAIKVARKWGYQVKGVPAGQATIVVADGNFHGRTTTIISFSTDPDARGGLRPVHPGLPDRALRRPGGAGAPRSTRPPSPCWSSRSRARRACCVPPAGYLPGVRGLCTERNVLFIADEIQSGLGRTGDTFACEHEGVVPDMYLLGKALGGGIVPVSAVVARTRTCSACCSRASTARPSAATRWPARSATEVVRLLRTGEFQRRSAELGDRLHARLAGLVGTGVVAVRGRGLWAGVDIDPALMTGREACERLMARGVLAKDTHGSTIRLAPPLVITADEVDHAVAAARRRAGRLTPYHGKGAGTAMVPARLRRCVALSPRAAARPPRAGAPSACRYDSISPVST